jgi:hypothetical protein
MSRSRILIANWRKEEEVEKRWEEVVVVGGGGGGGEEEEEFYYYLILRCSFLHAWDRGGEYISEDSISEDRG